MASPWAKVPIGIPLWPHPLSHSVGPSVLTPDISHSESQLGAPESQLMASQSANIYSHAAHSAQARCNYWRRMCRGHLLLGSARLGP